MYCTCLGPRRSFVFLFFRRLSFRVYIFPFLLCEYNYLASSLTIGYAQRVSSHVPAELHLIIAELILFHHRATSYPPLSYISSQTEQHILSMQQILHTQLKLLHQTLSSILPTLRYTFNRLSCCF
jgi:hypothetical protein